MPNVSDASLSRLVGRLVKRSVGPLIESLGFEWGRPREAWMAEGAATFFFQWKRVSGQFARFEQVPPSSIRAGFGVEYGSRVPLSAFRGRKPEMASYEQTSIRLFLSRTQRWTGEWTRSPDVWPVGSPVGAEAAVEDLARAITSQGTEFIARWSDPQWVFRELESQVRGDLDGEIGVGAMMLPGMPNSYNRLHHLAKLADLLGDREAERLQLERLLAKGEWPRYRARLDELEGPAPSG